MRSPAGLTTRQYQTLLLAADGKTCQEIADHLVLEVRTVRGYLREALLRTGCTSPAEAGAWLVNAAARLPSSEQDEATGRWWHAR